MQLKTILNSLQRHKSFVYQEARWADPNTNTKIEIPIEPRANSRPICSGCGQAAPGYDRLQPRRFEFVPLWQIAVYFVYAMRRHVEALFDGVGRESGWCDSRPRPISHHAEDEQGALCHNNHEVRSGEARQMKEDGYEPILKHSRWCLLKRPENLTDKQTVKLSELLKYNLRSTRAYLLREDFQRFWEYTSPAWAARFLDQWCSRTMRSKIEPMKKMARTLRNHRPLILNWFRAQGAISAGALSTNTVEGMNTKVKRTTRKSYGFRTYEAIEISLYHNLGRLPEPEFTHRFW